VNGNQMTRNEDAEKWYVPYLVEFVKQIKKVEEELLDIIKNK
jgi:hypothetical protein